MRQLDINQIKEMIPHRYPFLLIDRINELEPDVRAIAQKNVSVNENYFVGHFPSQPIMPGVLIIEAMAQAGGVLFVASRQTEDKKANKVVYFMSIEEAHFRKPVVPGDILYLHVEKMHGRGNVWKIKAEARVDGQRVADAIFSAMLVDEVVTND